MTSSPQRLYTSYNSWFLAPFIGWLLVGAAAEYFIGREGLFRLFNGHYNPLLDRVMFFATLMGEGLFSVLVLLMLMALPAFRSGWYFTAALLGNVLPALLTQWIKGVVDAPRPLRFFQEASWIHTLPEWPRLMQRSFPSGHTTAAFSLFCFLSLVLSPKYKWVGAVFFALALLSGISRMYLAVHFFIDVYVGSIIGVFFALAVVALMQRYAHFFVRKHPRV